MMRKITFYSYKGGVGRSLLLANTAHALARMGRRVLALDLDLEAPGLHYKLLDDISGAHAAGLLSIPNLVNHEWTTDGLRGSIAAVNDKIDLLPAQSLGDGSADGNYWRFMAGLRWRSEEGKNLLDALIRLLEQLESRGLYDYVLIDARTGVTEVGTIATHLLADTVVLCTIGTSECLSGTLQVYNSLVNQDQSPVLSDERVPIPVITRVAEPSRTPRWSDDWDNAERLRDRVRETLKLACEPRDIPVIRQDSKIQEVEEVLWARDRVPMRPVSLDFARLALSIEGHHNASALLRPLTQVDPDASDDLNRDRLLAIAHISPAPAVLLSLLELLANAPDRSYTLDVAIVSVLIALQDSDAVPRIEELLQPMHPDSGALATEEILSLANEWLMTRTDGDYRLRIGPELYGWIAKTASILGGRGQGLTAALLFPLDEKSASDLAFSVAPGSSSLLSIRSRILERRGDPGAAWEALKLAFEISSSEDERLAMADRMYKLATRQGDPEMARHLLATDGIATMLPPAEFAALNALAGDRELGLLWAAVALGEGHAAGQAIGASIFEDGSDPRLESLVDDLMRRLGIDNVKRKR